MTNPYFYYRVHITRDNTLASKIVGQTSTDKRTSQLKRKINHLFLFEIPQSAHLLEYKIVVLHFFCRKERVSKCGERNCGKQNSQLLQDLKEEKKEKETECEGDTTAPVI